MRSIYNWITRATFPSKILRLLHSLVGLFHCLCGECLQCLGYSEVQRCIKWSVVVQNATALLKGIQLDTVQHCHAVAMRKYVLQQLLDVGQPPARERVRCDAVGCKEPKGRAVRWICCDVCGRWMHFVCTDLKRKPRGPYICVVCHAQYD